MVDVVKRRVETVLEPKAVVTQIIAAELELKNTLESTVWMLAQGTRLMQLKRKLMQ